MPASNFTTHTLPPFSSPVLFAPLTHLGFSSLRHGVHLVRGATDKQRASFWLLLLVMLVLVLLAAFAA